MDTITLYSPIYDPHLQEHLQDAPMWSKSIHSDEIESKKDSYPDLWEYQIKFDGTTPVQVTKISKYK